MPIELSPGRIVSCPVMKAARPAVHDGCAQWSVKIAPSRPIESIAGVR